MTEPRGIINEAYHDSEEDEHNKICEDVQKRDQIQNEHVTKHDLKDVLVLEYEHDHKRHDGDHGCTETEQEHTNIDVNVVPQNSYNNEVSFEKTNENLKTNEDPDFVNNFYFTQIEIAEGVESGNVANVISEHVTNDLEITQKNTSKTDPEIATHMKKEHKLKSDEKWFGNGEILRRNKEKSLLQNGEFEESKLDICYKFSGPAFRSFSEKKLKRTWRRRSLEEESKLFSQLKESTPERNRSQYSLVSSGDLTAGAVELWLTLPEEVKYDPSLEPFLRLYEKEHGKEGIKLNDATPKSRLPLVNSAPQLNDNKQSEYVAFSGNDKKYESQTVEQRTGSKHSQTETKSSKMARAKYLIKMTLLIACWVFFTAVFLIFNEKEKVVRNSSVAPGQTKQYNLLEGERQLSVLLEITGPFLPETGQSQLNATTMKHFVTVWLEGKRWLSDVQKSEPWIIALQETDRDFSVGEKRTKRFQLDSTTQSSVFNLLIKSTASEAIPFTISYTLDPIEANTGVILSVVLLCGLYVMIIFEIINRTMAAVLTSTSALAVLSIAGERPSLPELVSWLDVETLLLLFSMMLLVAIVAETGMFDFLAVFTFEVTKGKLWPLISLLCAITAVVSTFLDNVTTVLLMAPVTLRLCEVMDLNPIPILMSMVLFSNIGGTATPVGDPPNVIIASNKNVIQAGVNFTNFTLHMTLGIILVCVQTYFQLRFMFRDTDKMRLCVPREIQELQHQISIWRRAADAVPHLSHDQNIVKLRLERKIRKLQTQLDGMLRDNSKRACPKDTFHTMLISLKDKYQIRDKVLLIKATVALTFVVGLFFLHAIPALNKVSLGWTALLGAILLLLLADREDLEPILHRVEWSTLLFFAALFVLMEALSKLGLIDYIGGLTESLILQVEQSSRLAVAILLLVWVSGITSAFVDNVPLTTMMVRVVTSLGCNPNLNLPMMPLIWALSFGVCLGGNGTLIGASANVVCAGVAEQHGYKFTFVYFFKIGFPIMIGHLVVASAYLLICHCVFTWH